MTACRVDEEDGPAEEESVSGDEEARGEEDGVRAERLSFHEESQKADGPGGFIEWRTTGEKGRGERERLDQQTKNKNLEGAPARFCAELLKLSILASAKPVMSCAAALREAERGVVCSCMWARGPLGNFHEDLDGPRCVKPSVCAVADWLEPRIHGGVLLHG